MKLPEFKARLDLTSVLDDFRTLNPNDVGTWPLLPRIVVLIAVFVFSFAFGWWFFLNDQFDLLSAKQNDELKLREEYIQKSNQAANLDLYTQQLEEIDHSFGALLKQLPNKSEVESLLVEISQAGLGRGLQFDLFKPGSEVLKEFYAELPISVRLTGSYHDFGAFAADVGALSRIVILGDLSVSANAQAKDGSLVMETSAKTFRYLDEEEVAKQKKAALEAKKGARK
ncbi:MAG: type 4a pilus biogenesis protein PilO [Betaproteobacteria bacterium]|nr:type 4a pilus biogenesis protein PilO [Betaproteobacteria bacterium]